MMTDEIVLEMCLSDNKSKVCGPRVQPKKINSNLELKEYLLSRFNDINENTTYQEIVFRIWKKIEVVPKCKNCGKEIKYNGSKGGYVDFCCHSCYSKYRTRNAIEKYQVTYNRSVNDKDVADFFILKNGNINGKACSEKYLIKKNPEILDYLKHRFDDIDSETTITELVYRVINHIEKLPICPICGKRIPFRKDKDMHKSRAYHTYCSKECAHSAEGYENTLNKTHSTFKERYGEDVSWFDLTCINEKTKIVTYDRDITDDDVVAYLFNKDTERVFSQRMVEDVLKVSNPTVYNYLYSRYSDIDSDTTIREILYRIMNNIEEVPVCAVCGNKVPFINKVGFTGYKIFCSEKCRTSETGYRITMLKRYNTCYPGREYVPKTKLSERLRIEFDNITDDDVIRFMYSDDICGYRFIRTDEMLEETNPKMLEYLRNRFKDTDENTPLMEIVYRIVHKLEEHPRCYHCGKLLNYVNNGYLTYCSDECLREEKDRHLNKCSVEKIKQLSDKDNIEKSVSKAKELNIERVYELDELTDDVIISYMLQNNFDRLEPSKSNVQNLLIRQPYIFYYVMNRFNDVDKKTTFDELLYRIKNHIETAPICPVCGNKSKFKDGRSGYSLFCSNKCASSDAGKKFVSEKIRNTLHEKYGDDVNCTLQVPEVIQKAEETCLEKYGVSHYSTCDKHKEDMRQFFENYYSDNSEEAVKHREEIRKKMKMGLVEKYGSVENFVSQNRRKSKLAAVNNNGMTKSEAEIYNYLLTVFSENDIIFNQIIDDRYPFRVDFYIVPYDIFIELNTYWTHGFHLFDETSEKDLHIIEEWKEKGKQYNEYNNAIKIWTEIDPLKVNTARTNNLNYLPIWDKKVQKIKQIISDYLDNFIKNKES